MKIDMKIGNPAFMKPYWEQANAWRPYTHTHPHFCMDYEKEGGKEELKEVIKELHESVGNAETKDYEVVIGNGATQLIFAALYVKEPERAYARKPHWFRFPEMVMMAHVGFTSNEEAATGDYFKLENNVEIVTYPSNPENRIYRPVVNNRIYDCCYHWPIYHDVNKLSEDIMIFSLAKTTGHAGSRIGWALVKNKEIAKEMAKYIEMTTGGVSVEAQERAIGLLKSQIKELKANKGWSCFNYGKSILKFRWEELLKYPNDLFTISNGSGMFAWCGFKEEISEDKTVSQALEEKTGILALNGTTCGGDRNDFRLNMGCDEETWEKFIEVIKKLSVEVKP